VPLTVAPPPRNGDAAQGTWCSDAPAFAASDRAAAHHDAPDTVPTLPMSAAIARTMAAGVLFIAAALSIPAAVGLILAAGLALARAGGNTRAVGLRLVAHEKSCNARQNFRVTWRLQRVAGKWRVAGLRASALGRRSCD
jgi:hypothetical protein